ncbi:aldehyde dehydrogenase family protein, partial [Mesorhizobium sp. M00.F.Ca.ET.186.01.1.1]
MTTTHKNYINGEWVDSHTGQVFPSTNPANTSEVLGYFQKSDGLDARAAIEAAAQAFPDWAKKSAPVRGEFLFTLIRLLEEQKEELAAIITSEVGKTLREARGEVLKTIASM